LNDSEEFRVSDVPVVHAARVIRPCALDRLRLDADRPQDSAHPRWLHTEQCRQFQSSDSHQSLRPPLALVEVLYGGNFYLYLIKAVYFSFALWYITIGG